MSDIATTDIADVTTGAPTSDVSVDSSPATPVDSQGSQPSDQTNTQGFEYNDYDRIFGLESEEKPTQETQTDVTKVTDPPVPHRDAEAATNGDQPKPEGEQPEAKADTAATDANEDGQFKSSDKLNWESAPEQFRKEYQELKNYALDLAKSSVETNYVSEPASFANWMKETSPTSYREVGTILATESAEQHPQQWVEYFRENHPDILAQVVTGKEDATLDRLKAELALLSDDDDADVQKKLEDQKAEADKAKAPEETEDQRIIREFKEEREKAKQQEVTSSVFNPIESEINQLVSQAGLEIDLSKLKGQDFATLDDETRFKVFVSEMLPVWIDSRIQSDPKLQNMQGRLQEFINQKDLSSAMKLQHPARIAATNLANEFLAIVTGKRVAAKQEEFVAPNPDPPKPHVNSAGASAGFSSDTGEIDWSGKIGG